MPPPLLTHRPQTLKQAKKAYRKSGGTTRLSESEKAILERRAVLQERADRIKEREARRKANLKRKEERVQREREVRHRMGIPTPPTKEGLHVGPSQLHLSGFMYAGVKMKTEDKVEEDETEDGIQKQGERVVQEQQEHPMEPPKSRQPLQTFPANASPHWIMPSQPMNANPPKVPYLAQQANQTSPKRTPPARAPLQAKSANPTTQQKPLAGNKNIGGLQANASYLQRPLHSEHQGAATKPTLPSKPEAIPEDYLDDFFVSNTQIQRELSPPPTPPAKSTPHTISIARPPTPSPAFNRPTTAEGTADLLAFISTQDLDFADSLTQLPPLAPQHSPHNRLKFDDEDFPDSELEDIVLEFSLESSVGSTNPDSQPPNPEVLTRSDSDEGGGGSHYDSDDADDAEMLQKMFKEYDYEKERECQDAQRAAECDAFALSTQDLMELES